jgi:hypothetical protein
MRSERLLMRSISSRLLMRAATVGVLVIGLVPRISDLQPTLTGIYKEIQKAAPNAQIAVLTYPQIYAAIASNLKAYLGGNWPAGSVLRFGV